MITAKNCLLSIKFILSNAKEDIVVNDPQNPIATRKEYFESRLKDTDNMEKIPKIKLPIMFTSNTFETRLPSISGKDTILYLTKAPNIAPPARKRNSIPFIDQ